MRRLHRLAPSLAAGLVLLAPAATAWAQRGVEVQTFHPASDAYGIFTVERAETGRQWDVGFRVYADYAHQPLKLSLKATGGRTAMMAFQVGLHLGAHLSFTNWLQLSLQLPIAAQQFTKEYGTREPVGLTGFVLAGSPTNVGPPDASVLDPRISLKARTPRLGPVGLALLLTATLPLGDDAHFNGDSSFTFRPQAIIDLTVGRFTAAINAGYVLRRTTAVVDPIDVVAKSPTPATVIEVGHELTWAAGAAYRFVSFLGAGVEAYGLLPFAVDKSPVGREPASSPDRTVDLLGGLHFFPGRNLTLAVGGGAGLPIGARRHDTFRVFLGLSFAPVEAGRGGSAVSGGLDGDGDGIPDGPDLCPTEAEDKDGFDDEDGCPELDNDQDGIADGADKCPAEAEDRDGFQDDDGCPDRDNDEDGVPDYADKCAAEAEDKDGVQDDDGCPDLDNDQDGIPDGKDACPNEAETKNGIDDEDGCPDTGGQVAIAEGRVELPEQIQFETGKAEILARSFALLERIALKLKERPTVRVRIEGHTDNQGSEPKNQELSEARARSVVEGLVQRGIDRARLTATGFGASRPIATNRTEGGRAKNRRVEFIIVEQ